MKIIHCLAGLCSAAALVACEATPAASQSRPAPSQEFDVVNRFDLSVPADGHELQAWFALPDDEEALQQVERLDWKIEAPEGLEYQVAETRDARGNRYLHVSAAEAGGAKLAVVTSFGLRRSEARATIDPARTRPLTEAERASRASYLAESRNIVITPAIRADAERIVGAEKNPIVQARLLYDWVLEHVQYWVKDPTRWKSSGVGSSTYTYEKCTGNCTDFHSLYTAAARAVGLPARMVYGSFFKGPLDGQPQDQSYHCWVEFWAPELGWIPIDVAVADIFVDDFQTTEASARGVELTVADGYHGPDARLVDYYFGNLDSRRVTWNRGRDLELSPTPAAGPINALPKAHIEVDGKPLAEKESWTRLLSFREVK